MPRIRADPTRRPPRQVRKLPPQSLVNLTQPFVPTDAQRARCKVLVACGFTQESVSVIMDIPLATLERHFKHELTHGKILMDAKILGGIVEQAAEGDKTLAMFYARSRTGWRDFGGKGSEQADNTFTINISNGDNGTDIKVTHNPTPPTIDGEAEEDPKW